MGNNGLPKLVNSPFTRVQPALCGFCKYYKQGAGIGHYQGFDLCNAKGKYLSNAHATNGKCSLFEKAPEQVATDEMITMWREDAASHQEWLKKRKGQYA